MLQLVPFQPAAATLATTVHAVAVGQDMAAVGEAGNPLGGLWMLQAEPLQRSTSGPDPASPIAVQAVAALHEIPLRLPEVVPDGNGTLSSAHPVLVRRSDSGIPVGKATVWPTARQELADPHQTEARMLELVVDGFLALCIDHALPFQPSASGT